jgi:hypothetical protein
MVEGIAPVNRFARRSRTASSERLPMKKYNYKWKRVTNILPIESGIGPSISKPVRFMTVTLSPMHAKGLVQIVSGLEKLNRLASSPQHLRISESMDKDWPNRNLPGSFAAE